MGFFRRARRLANPGAPPRVATRPLLVWGTVLACGAGVVLSAGLPGGRRLYQPGPVAPAHSAAPDDCAACHTRPFRGALRLVSCGAGRSTPDGACRSCHAPAPHAGEGPTVTACAGCHPEHRGADALRGRDSAGCLRCHARLPAGGTGQGVTGFPDGHPAWAPGPDAGGLRFDHAAHLRPGGVAGPRRVPARLDCAACHRPDAAGRSMLPVRYADHCARCHPLSVRLAGAPEALREAAERFAREPAPHLPPALVRAVLRERLRALAAEWPPSPGRPDPPVFRGPTGTRSTTTSAAGPPLAQVEAALFEHGGGCRFCHQPARGKATHRPGDLPAFEPTRLPQRWLRGVTFNHAAHRTTACADCHPAQDSRQARDVLIPSSASCARCHRPGGPARPDCFECHSYHQRRGVSRGEE